MASCYHSSAAKVSPECFPPPHLLTSQFPKTSMASPLSPDLLTNPLRNNEPPAPDDLIKPVIVFLDKKIRLDPTTEAGAMFCPTVNRSDRKQAIRRHSAYQASATPEVKLWPRHTELEDHPSSPPCYQGAAKQETERPLIPSVKTKANAIIAPAYPFPKHTELDDRPPSSPSFKLRQAQLISEPAFRAEQSNGPSSPPYGNVRKSRMSAGREAEYRLSNQAERKSDEPKTQMTSAEGDEVWVCDDKLPEMKESNRNSARGRLSSVVEESESFSRRELGANVLSYMSTHSSANHAANLSNYSSYNHSHISYKYPSNLHSNLSNLSYTHKPANFMNSKSAPAGFAVRSRSVFALFRRGSSEGGKLGGRVTYYRQKSRKPKSLGGTLLWPLKKIRNGYVGCMMGLEGSGDLSGMAQGGTYATSPQFFADIPLSKTDSRNHG